MGAGTTPVQKPCTTGAQSGPNGPAWTRPESSLEARRLGHKLRREADWQLPGTGEGDRRDCLVGMRLVLGDENIETRLPMVSQL